MKLKNMIYCGIFAALISVGAFIKIPIPLIPFTLQTFFVISSGLILGSRRGALSCIIYMMLGLIGIPVFTQGGGLWYIAKPTFGYILGFVLGSFVSGKTRERYHINSVFGLFLSGIVGIVIIYLIGYFYYYFICNFIINTPIALIPLFTTGVLPTLPGDIVLCVLSAYLSKKVVLK